MDHQLVLLVPQCSLIEGVDGLVLGLRSPGADPACGPGFWDAPSTGVVEILETLLIVDPNEIK